MGVGFEGEGVVVMERAVEEVDCAAKELVVVVVAGVVWVVVVVPVVLAFGKEDARKAERKVDRKGRLEGRVGSSWG